MPHYYPPQRSITPSSPPYTNYYPGVIPQETSLPLKAESSALVPYSPQTTASEGASLPAAAGGAAKSTGGFSMPNLNDIKGIVDRLGGIEGILATVGKVQKVMQTFQQFAPMAKLITGLLPGGKGSKFQSGSGGLDEYKPSRRRRSKGGSKNSSRKRNARSKSPTRGRSKSSKRRR